MKLIYLSLTVACANMLSCMEPQPPTLQKRDSIELQKHRDAAVETATLSPRSQDDLEKGVMLFDENQLSHELISAIRGGRTSYMHSLLTKQPSRAAELSSMDAATRNADTLTNALGFVESQLTPANEAQAVQFLDRFFPRYKYAVLPTGAATILTANFILACIQYYNQNPRTQLASGAFAVEVIASIGGAALAWQRALKELRKGWYDTRKDKADEKLKDAQLLLTMLKQQMASADGSLKDALALKIQAQEGVVADLIVADNAALIAAQKADAQAAAAEKEEANDAAPSGSNNNNNNNTIDTSTIRSIIVSGDRIEIFHNYAPAEAVTPAADLTTRLEAIDTVIEATSPLPERSLVEQEKHALEGINEQASKEIVAEKETAHADVTLQDIMEDEARSAAVEKKHTTELKNIEEQNALFQELAKKVDSSLDLDPQGEPINWATMDACTEDMSHLKHFENKQTTENNNIAMVAAQAPEDVEQHRNVDAAKDYSENKEPLGFND